MSSLLLQKDFLSEKGYDPQFGARPLHRAIQKYVEDPLAEEILKCNVNEGDTIVADLDADAKIKLKFEIRKKKKKKQKMAKRRNKLIIFFL